MEALGNVRLPENNVLKGRLKTWVMEINAEKAKMEAAIEKAGKFSERALWVKLNDLGKLNQEYLLTDLSEIWYEVDSNLISRKRLNRIKEELKGCMPYGQGYFDTVSGKHDTWKPISEKELKSAKNEISKGATQDSYFPAFLSIRSI